MTITVPSARWFALLAAAFAILLANAGVVAANGGTPAAGSVAARVIDGEYRSEGIAAGERRGGERFQLVVHADGSRTLSISSDLTWRNAWFTVVLRSAADFRPLEAYASYWSAGRYKGSGHFSVDGSRLLAVSTGPESGRQTQEIEVPQRFSMGTHPVSADGWHTAGIIAASPTKRQFPIYSVEAGADLAKPVLGTLVSLEVEYLGEETIEVPAGRFVAGRYRLAGMNDLWVHGPDRLVIRSDLPARGLRYVLTTLQVR